MGPRDRAHSGRLLNFVQRGRNMTGCPAVPPCLLSVVSNDLPADAVRSTVASPFRSHMRYKNPRIIKQCVRRTADRLGVPVDGVQRRSPSSAAASSTRCDMLGNRKHCQTNNTVNAFFFNRLDLSTAWTRLISCVVHERR